jgi:methylated-DNA-protein-cysteine methyltransferase related protein
MTGSRSKKIGLRSATHREVGNTSRVGNTIGAVRGQSGKVGRRVEVRAKEQHSKMENAQDNASRILDAVRRIPKGRVSTYGAVAEAAGLPRRARLVGTVLRQTTVRNVPWFRVINSGGRISFPRGSEAYDRQRTKLEQEGVAFISGRVDLGNYGWPASLASLDEFLWSPPKK